MPRTDIDIENLKAYRSDVVCPEDFDGFWDSTLLAARDARSETVAARVDGPLREVEVHDLEFSGYGGHRIKAWYLRPARRPEPLPVMVRYSGYGRGRSFPHEHLVAVAAGYAYVVMDTRGQGGPHAPGATPDPTGSDPSSTGFMTRGIRDPRTYYFTRVIADAVRLVDEVAELDGVDPDRIALMGNSQGGGIAIAASGLSTQHAALLAAHPCLADFPRALAISPNDPYDEIVRYLRVNPSAESDVMRTLRYVDAVNFASRSAVPALFATGLMDPVCPPSTAFAVQAAYAGDSELRVFPYGDHDSGGPTHVVEQLEWLGSAMNSQGGEYGYSNHV